MTSEDTLQEWSETFELLRETGLEPMSAGVGAVIAINHDADGHD